MTQDKKKKTVKNLYAFFLGLHTLFWLQLRKIRLSLNDMSKVRVILLDGPFCV